MKTLVGTILCLALVAVLLPAQSLTENPFFVQSIEFKRLAEAAFDEGEYDLAVEYAVKSRDFAELSNRYVQTMLLKREAERSLITAESRIAWAVEVDAARWYPAELGSARTQLDAARTAFQLEEFRIAKVEADKAVASLAGVEDLRPRIAALKRQAETAIKAAAERYAWAQGVSAERYHPVEFAAAGPLLDAARQAFNREEFESATTNANNVLAVLATVEDHGPRIAAMRDRAEKAIAAASERYAWAASVSADLFYPNDFATATALLTSARQAFQDEDYEWARSNAEDVLTALAGVEDQGPRIAGLRLRAQEAIRSAEARYAWAKGVSAARFHPKEFADATEALASARSAFDKEDYEQARVMAEATLAALARVEDHGPRIAALRRRAEEAIRSAQERYNWAESVKAEVFHPKEYGTATELLGSAKSAFGQEEYEQARIKAEATLAALASVEDHGPRLTALAALRQRAESAIKAAGDRYAWAESVSAARFHPDEFALATQLLGSAKSAFGQENYDQAILKAEAVLTALAKVEDHGPRLAALAALAALRQRAETAIAAAEKRYAWAETVSAARFHPMEFTAATTALGTAKTAFNQEDYEKARIKAEETLAALANVVDHGPRIAALRQRAEHAIKSAQERYSWAQSVKAEAFHPKEFTVATELLASAKSAFGQEEYEQARIKAEAALTALASVEDHGPRIAALRQRAEDAIKSAEVRRAWALGIQGERRYPLELGAATEFLNSAKAAFRREDYETARVQAEAVILQLAGLQPLEPLPAVFIVRDMPGNEDCFWRIAELPYIYNDPFQWPVLYLANKSRLPDPDNPHLVLTETVLTIPSLKGEFRDGTWNPDFEYPIFGQ
jgi:hypothetical protein